MITKELYQKGHIDYPIFLNLNNVHLKERVLLLVKELKSELITSDKHILFWVRGSSGVATATLLSSHFENSSIIYCRKPSEYNHGHGMKHDPNNTTNIIVDDFSFTGETIGEIIKDMSPLVFNIDAIALLGDCEKSIIESLAEQFNIIINNLIYII